MFFISVETPFHKLAYLKRVRTVIFTIFKTTFCDYDYYIEDC